MPKVRSFVALALVAGALALVPPSGAGATGSQFTEHFDSASWWTGWGMTAMPFRTSRESNLADGNFLRVTFAMHEHTGTTFFYDTGASESVRLRYRIRFSPNWVPMTAESGKIPGFGRPNRTAGGCTQACGGEPIVGNDPYHSERASFGMGNSGGSYVYAPQCTGDPAPVPDADGKVYGVRYDWGAFHFANGVWYDVDQTLTMNTPDQHDGTLFVKVNGNLVLSRTDLCLRKVAGVPVGNAWMDFFYGGAETSPSLQWIDLDEVIVNY
jgi:hypothetical protein